MDSASQLSEDSSHSHELDPISEKLAKLTDLGCLKLNFDLLRDAIELLQEQQAQFSLKLQERNSFSLGNAPVSGENDEGKNQIAKDETLAVAQAPQQRMSVVSEEAFSGVTQTASKLKKQVKALERQLTDLSEDLKKVKDSAYKDKLQVKGLGEKLEMQGRDLVNFQAQLEVAAQTAQSAKTLAELADPSQITQNIMAQFKLQLEGRINKHDDEISDTLGKSVK